MNTFLIFTFPVVLIFSSIFGYQQSAPLEDKQVQSPITDDCIMWFDGCNTCSLDLTGQAFCTEKFCDFSEYKEKECLRYK